jgi:predicted DsbA family dithiol-disulfide isomerase
LAAASRQANVNYKLAWEPFLLNPNMDDAGEDMRAHLTGKYGPRGAKMLDDPNSGLMVSGRSVGIAFNNNRKIYPTVKVSDLCCAAETDHVFLWCFWYTTAAAACLTVFI